MGIYKTPVAIILPCYNEEKSLNKVINDIKIILRNIRIILFL